MHVSLISGPVVETKIHLFNSLVEETEGLLQYQVPQRGGSKISVASGAETDAYRIALAIFVEQYFLNFHDNDKDENDTWQLMVKGVIESIKVSKEKKDVKEGTSTLRNTMLALFEHYIAQKELNNEIKAAEHFKKSFQRLKQRIDDSKNHEEEGVAVSFLGLPSILKPSWFKL